MADEVVQPTKAEILDCLSRSGYLMESRLVRSLNDTGWFVEPNQSVEDPITGKSREIDLVAEHYEPQTDNHNGCVVKTHFAVEAINNIYPLILMTPRPDSPNAPVEEHMRIYVTGPSNIHQKLSRTSYYDKKIPPTDSLYSQYCSLTRKKEGAGEWLASHPDDLYTSLWKAVHYCSSELALRNDDEITPDEKYWRIFAWQPVLVVARDLYVIDMDQAGTPALRESSSVNLEFNFHDAGRRRSMIVTIVTEAAFLPTLEKIVEDDKEIQRELAVVRGTE